MKLQLEIEMDNAAFDINGAEVARIFRKLADHVESEMTLLMEGDKSSLFDANGNLVGRWEIV